MLLQEYLPDYHFSERHETVVKAPQDVAYDAARSVDFSRSVIIRSLLWLRELPGRVGRWDFEAKGLGPSLDDFLDAGFIRLAEDPPNELVLGAAGRFWKLTPEFLPLSPEEYKSFDQPGFAKIGFNIRVEKTDDRQCLVSTESRILCLDDRSRRRFRYYWVLIRPFSGLIRLVMLRAIRRAAENAGCGCR